jgi:hypothetical protein
VQVPGHQLDSALSSFFDAFEMLLASMLFFLFVVCYAILIKQVEFKAPICKNNPLYPMANEYLRQYLPNPGRIQGDNQSVMIGNITYIFVFP